MINSFTEALENEFAFQRMHGKSNVEALVAALDELELDYYHKHTVADLDDSIELEF